MSRNVNELFMQTTITNPAEGEKQANDQQDLAMYKEEPGAVRDAEMNQPQSNQHGQANHNPAPMMNVGIPSAQLQAQQQMILMAQQMFNMQQRAQMEGGQDGSSKNPIVPQQQDMAQLMSFQQQQHQAQLDFLQSMSRNNNSMAPNMMGMNPAQHQMNQLLFSGIGGNMGGLLSSFNQSHSNTVPTISTSAGTTPCEANNTAVANKRLQKEDDGNDPGWEDQYKALQRYRLVHGHTKVPARYKENPKLGRWVMTQRRQMALMQKGYPNALTVERIAKLDDISFAWSVKPEPIDTWNQKIKELKEYKETFGNTLVPQRFQSNPQLGTWVHTQRRQYKLLSDGKKSSMTKEKIDALNAIGFVWVARQNDIDESDVEDAKKSSEGSVEKKPAASACEITGDIVEKTTKEIADV